MTASPDHRYSVPILLGVTGHNHLRPQDVPALAAAVRTVFVEFQQDYPHSPLVLLTSLAEGADQVCAEVALACGARVEAVMPLPREVYLESTSFTSDESRNKFVSLLRDSRVTSSVAPLPPELEPKSLDEWRAMAAQADERRMCYANAGGQIAARCQALLALWDGEEATRPSGTPEIVRFKREGRRPKHYPFKYALFSWSETGPVYRVHTPRIDTSAPGRVGERTELYPLPHEHGGKHAHDTPAAAAQEKRRFERACEQLDAFNHELNRRRLSQADEARQIKRLLPASEVECPTELGRLAAVRGVASELSAKASQRLVQLHVALFIAIFLAVFFFHLYAHWYADHHAHTHNPVWLALFAACLAVGFGIVFVVKALRLEEQALDYRALAEALRVQFYWGVAGVMDSAADHYLQQVRGEVLWVRYAVYACTPAPQQIAEFFRRRGGGLSTTRITAVRDHWICQQLAWHGRQHNGFHAYNVWFRGLGLTAALAGWLVVLSPLAVDLLRMTAAGHWLGLTPGEKWWSIKPSELLIIGSGTVTLLGGLSIAYAERWLWEDLSRQYERMFGLYAAAETRLNELLEAEAPAKEVQALLLEVGREALIENASWLVLRRAHPFEALVH